MNETQSMGLSYEQVKANLAKRNLSNVVEYPQPYDQIPTVFGVKAYTSTTGRWLWDHAISPIGHLLGSVPHSVDRALHGRKESPTYKAVTGQPYKTKLMEELAADGSLSLDDMFNENQGLVKFRGIDYLAVSELPENKVYRLAAEGYGVWPVLPVVSVKESAKVVGLDLSQEQLALVEKAVGLDRRTKAIWFEDERLISSDKPIEPSYVLPNISEILQAFGCFYQQEGFYPHSWDKSFLTDTTVEVNLEKAFRNRFKDWTPFDYLTAAFANHSSYSDIIKYWLQHEEDFYRNMGSYTVERSKGTFSVENIEKGTLFMQHKPSHYLFVGGNTSVELEKGVFSVENIEKGTLLSEYEADLNKRVKASSQAAQEFFSGPNDYFLVLSSHAKKGVSLGVGEYPAVNREGEVPIDDIGEINDFLNIDYMDMLASDLSRAVGGLPVIESYDWPRIFTDQEAPSVLNLK